MLGPSLIALVLGAPTPASPDRLPDGVPTAVPAREPEPEPAPELEPGKDRPDPAARAHQDSAPEHEHPDPGSGQDESRGSGWAGVFRPRARVMTGLVVRDGVTSLFLRQARIGVRARTDRFELKISADLADGLDNFGSAPFIRDAWANVKIHEAFQVKVGRFKRPFSRLELRGVWKHAFLDRGLFNAFAIEDRDWGDRAVGANVWGRIRGRPGRLKWAVGASTPCPLGTGCPVRGAPGVTVGGRVEYEPVRWISIGVNSAYKQVRIREIPATVGPDEIHTGHVAAVGGDIRVKGRGFYGAAEFNAAHDWRCPLTADCSSPDNDIPWMVSGIVHGTYTFDVGPKTTVGPVIIGEIVDADLRYSGSEAVRAAAGIDLRWTKHLRVLPQIDVVRSLQTPLGYVSSFRESVELVLLVGVRI